MRVTLATKIDCRIEFQVTKNATHVKGEAYKLFHSQCWTAVNTRLASHIWYSDNMNFGEKLFNISFLNECFRGSLWFAALQKPRLKGVLEGLMNKWRAGCKMPLRVLMVAPMPYLIWWWNWRRWSRCFCRLAACGRDILWDGWRGGLCGWGGCSLWNRSFNLVLWRRNTKLTEIIEDQLFSVN